jgi:hypothetical protein
LNALFRHVTGECGAKGDISEVGIRADVTHPRGKIGRRIHRQRQRVALTHGDVDELQVPLFAEVRHLAGRIERGAHDRERMREQLHTTLAGRRRSCWLRLRRARLRSREESAADVIGDIAVERLIRPIESELPDRRGEDEIHLQALLHARAPVLEIDRPCVLEYLLPLLRALDRR